MKIKNVDGVKVYKINLKQVTGFETIVLLTENKKHIVAKLAHILIISCV